MLSGSLPMVDRIHADCKERGCDLAPTRRQTMAGKAIAAPVARARRSPELPYCSEGKMKAFDVLRRLLIGTESTASSLQRIDAKFDALIAAHSNQTELLNRQLNRAVDTLT